MSDGHQRHRGALRVSSYFELYHVSRIVRKAQRLDADTQRPVLVLIGAMALAWRQWQQPKPTNTATPTNTSSPAATVPALPPITTSIATPAQGPLS